MQGLQGLRTGEITQANVDDLQGQGDSWALLVHAKSHDRLVFPSPDVTEAVRAYLAARRTIPPDEWWSSARDFSGRDCRDSSHTQGVGWRQGVSAGAKPFITITESKGRTLAWIRPTTSRFLKRSTRMPKTMKAAVVRTFGAPLEISEVPVPTPADGEVLVKIQATGVCHTDLHAVDGDWPVKPTPPFTPGHEGAGIVAAVGHGVKRVKEGDRVGIAWLHDACGECEWCITGWETLCPYQHNSGYSVNGSFAEYAIGSSAYVGLLPPKVQFVEIAPILCAGVTVYKGIKEADVRPGQWIAVSGVGGLGQLTIQYAKAMGLRVVALDVTSGKLELARNSGADVAVNATDSDAASQVVNVTGGGAHGIIVTAPSPAAFGQAVGMARRKGTLVLIGLPPGSFPTPIFDVVLKRITIRGSIVGTREDLAEALQFAADGLVRSHIQIATLGDVNRVFADLRRGNVVGRIVLDFTRTQQ